MKSTRDGRQKGACSCGQGGLWAQIFLGRNSWVNSPLAQIRVCFVHLHALGKAGSKNLPPAQTFLGREIKPQPLVPGESFAHLRTNYHGQGNPEHQRLLRLVPALSLSNKGELSEWQRHGEQEEGISLRKGCWADTSTSMETPTYFFIHSLKLTH